MSDGAWFARLQHLLPQHGLSRSVHALARSEWGPLKNALIRYFVNNYPVNMCEAAQPDAFAYPSFDAFFTRALAADARPFAAESDALACPVDGTLSQLGEIRDGRIMQAKDRDFSLRELLADDPGWQSFRDGSFATVYLAPYNYHRIHMPVAGRLHSMLHVPGRLFSVNAATARHVPNLYARNERVVCLFDTEFGKLAVVLVGALNVGSIETVWAGTVTPKRTREVRHWRYPDADARQLARGEELGRFCLGSTVVMLFERDRVTWSPTLSPGATVNLGEAVGRISKT